MSFFRKQTTSINNQTTLIKTLKAMGYNPVEHEEKVPVRGHGSETRKAEVILRKEDMGDGGDIGFTKDKDGNFEMVTDTYVMKKINQADFIKKLNVEYGIIRAKDIAKQRGYQLLTSKAVTKDGVTKQVMTFTVA